MKRTNVIIPEITEDERKILLLLKNKRFLLWWHPGMNPFMECDDSIDYPAPEVVVSLLQKGLILQDLDIRTLYRLTRLSQIINIPGDNTPGDLKPTKE